MATFGYTGAGTSTVGSALSFEGSRFTGVAGTGVSMSFSVAKFGGAGSVNWQSNIYIQSTSALLTNGVTTEGSGTGTITKQWKTANFASAPTFSAVDYLLFLWSSDPSFGVWPLCIYYDTGAANQGYEDQTGASYKTWPSTGTFNLSTRKISIYATYTAAGGATNTTNFFQFI